MMVRGHLLCSQNWVRSLIFSLVDIDSLCVKPESRARQIHLFSVLIHLLNASIAEQFSILRLNRLEIFAKTINFGTYPLSVLLLRSLPLLADRHHFLSFRFAVYSCLSRHCNLICHNPIRYVRILKRSIGSHLKFVIVSYRFYFIFVGLINISVFFVHFPLKAIHSLDLVGGDSHKFSVVVGVNQVLGVGRAQSNIVERHFFVFKYIFAKHGRVRGYFSFGGIEVGNFNLELFTRVWC